MDAAIDALEDLVPLEDLIDDVLADQLVIGQHCWGSELSGRVCNPNFRPGTNHLKNKFCGVCRKDGFAVAAHRVRSVSDKALFSNTNGRSVWTNGRRLCNQTMKCVGPPVVIFEDSVAAEAATSCEAMPDHALRRDASGSLHVHFTIKLGTLVPTLSAEAAKRAREDDEHTDNERRLACLPRAALGGFGASAADVAALAAAACQAHIQRELRERIGLCAATIGALSRAERVVMHRMFREAMERQLALSVGDACLARVLQAFELGGEFGALDGEQAGLLLLCGLLCDEGVWADVVQQLSERRGRALVDGTAAAPHPQLGTAHLSQVTNSLQLLSCCSAVAACATGSPHAPAVTADAPARFELVAEDWRAAVRHSAERIEQMLQAKDAPWHGDVQEGNACCVRTCSADGIFYVLTNAEIGVDEDDALDMPGARATEVLMRGLELLGAQPEPAATRKGLWCWPRLLGAPVGVRASFDKLFNSAAHVLEVYNEEHHDGVRVAFVEWDHERDRPLGMSEAQNVEMQHANLTVLSIHFDAGACVWRASWADAIVIPTVLRSLGDGPATIVAAVFNWFVRAFTPLCIKYLSQAVAELRATPTPRHLPIAC